MPNGGYVTGIVLEVVKNHFDTSLAKQNQPHTIALHVEFLRRTQVGPATFKVHDVKLGRQTSIVHVAMEQDSRQASAPLQSVKRPMLTLYTLLQEIIAYVTNSNIDKEDGLSFDTQYKLTPPAPTVDLSRLEEDNDANWKLQSEMPFAKFRKATST